LPEIFNVKMVRFDPWSYSSLPVLWHC